MPPPPKPIITHSIRNHFYLETNCSEDFFSKYKFGIEILIHWGKPHLAPVCLHRLLEMWENFAGQASKPGPPGTVPPNRYLNLTDAVMLDKCWPAPGNGVWVLEPFGRVRDGFLEEGTRLLERGLRYFWVVWGNPVGVAELIEHESTDYKERSRSPVPGAGLDP